jgi:hypothetical protein
MGTWPGIPQIVFTLRLTSVFKTLPLALACLHASLALAQSGPADPGRMPLTPEQRQQMWQQMTPEQREAFRAARTPEERQRALQGLHPEQRREM